MNNAIPMQLRNPHYLAIALVVILAFSYLVISEKLPFASTSSFSFQKPFTISSDISSEQVQKGMPVTFSVTVTSNARLPQKVLVDIEIYDSDNKRVFQKYWDNARLVKDRQVTYEVISPAELAPGKYKFWVGIFQPGWGKTLAFQDAGTFVVSQAGQPGGNTALVAGNTSVYEK